MKVEEDELRFVLREAIADINTRKKKIDKVKELMYNMFNITNGETVFILNGKTPLDFMQKEMLFKVTKVLYEFNSRIGAEFDKEKLDVEKYFTEDEIIVYSQKIDRKKQDRDIVIKAGNWMKVEDDQYVIKIYPDELMYDYINRDKINYNPETQRYLTTIKTREGNEIQVITFDEDACGEIFDDMLNNFYISDMLALNVNPDYYLPPKVVNGDIIIPSKSVIDLIDGYHRLKAAINTKIRKPEWNQPLTFFLFICDTQKARRYILQEDEKIHLTKEQVEKTDELNPVIFIIEKLKKDVNFILRDTIKDHKETVINKTITRVFNPKKLYPENRPEAVKIYHFIKNNINDYIENNNLFGIEISKEKWFIFLYTLKYCMDNKKEFHDIINKLDIDSIEKKMDFTKTPSNKHYKIMKGVLKNV